MKYDIAIAIPLLFVVSALLVDHHANGQTKTVPMTVIRNGVPVTVMRTISQGTNSTVQLDSTGRPVTAAPNVTPPGNQAVQTVEQLRLQKLLALQFNRTGTAYLQQWSAANLPEPVEDETNRGEGTANQEKLSQDVPSNSKQWQPSDLPPSPLVKAKPITPEQTKEIEKEVKRFEQNVVLAEWDQVQKYMTGLPKEDAKKLHAHMIVRLSISNSQVMTASSEMTPEQQMAMQVKQQANSAGIREATLVSADDVLGLIRCAPGEIDEQQLKSLSQILSIVKSKQHEIEDFVAALDKGIGGIGGKEPAKRELVATLLLSARLSKSAQPFLPPLENAIKEKNLKRVQLHLMYVEQSYALEKKPEQLEQNWRLIQFLLAQDSLKVAERRSLLQKAVANASRIRKELGDQWLEDSFTKDPDRGLQIVANLGATVSQNFVSRYQSPHARIDSLKLQNNAVESLIRVAPVLAKKWQPALNVLVDNWIQEAETAIRYYYDHNSRPRMQLDMYGNYYWASQNQNQYYGNQRRPRPITPTELLRLRPSDQWQSLILESRRNRFNSVLAQLYLKNEQENEAFPYIERVAQRDPKQARSLANEFMQAWTRSHDPNSARRNRNPYIYVYGYDTKADAIPLTRSKQERNLAELKIWIEKIRALPIEPLDEKVLARAFTTSHSQAEVYKIEAFENVFGSIDSLKPETIASIGHTMRENLGGKWRQVQLQEATKTKRKEPEVQQEVIEGYIAALNIVEQSLAKHPENWQLMLAKACLYFEQNAYHGTIAKSSTFTEERDKAFAMFKNAASLYEQRVPELEEKDHKVEIYQRWFYASLGACDVRRITHETVPDSRQHAMIRAALDQLPGDLAEKHLAKFANDLFTRMSPLKPQVKFRYLDGGFAIVGDHPRAAEAQKVYQYYRDLVTEIKLEIQIDGSDNVGHTQPFGLFVNLIHTPEIERESGGFAKYVQNQNQANYAYNYGRPTEDYRDKFEEETAKALSEHFEVLSVILKIPNR